MVSTPPSGPGSKWAGTLVHRPDNQNPRNQDPAVARPGTKEDPTDLAPGLRPRPHPEVPKLQLQFVEIPPPPPPPGPAPKLPEAKPFKLPLRTPRDPNSPATNRQKTIGKSKMPQPGDLIDELTSLLKAKGMHRQFEEPKRIPPLMMPSRLDDMRAEMPDVVAQLKPVGKTVSRIREEMESNRLKEEEHKRMSPTAPDTPRPATKHKPYTLSTISEERVTEERKPASPGKATAPPPKKADLGKGESVSKPWVRPEVVPKLNRPIIAQNTVEEQPVAAPLNSTLSASHLAPENADIYIIWAIKAFGILLVSLGLIKTEIYLWLISWNMYLWIQMNL